MGGVLYEERGEWESYCLIKGIQKWKGRCMRWVGKGRGAV